MKKLIFVLTLCSCSFVFAQGIGTGGGIVANIQCEHLKKKEITNQEYFVLQMAKFESSYKNQTFTQVIDSILASKVINLDHMIKQKEKIEAEGTIIAQPNKVCDCKEEREGLEGAKKIINEIITIHQQYNSLCIEKNSENQMIIDNKLREVVKILDSRQKNLELTNDENSDNSKE